MNAEKKLLLEMREEIDKLPEVHQQQIDDMARHFRLELNAGGSIARVALALVGAELAVEYADAIP